MAIGIGTDFKIYQDQVNGAFVETVMQFIDAFGAASRNAILLTTEAHRGDYDYESFFLQAVTAIPRNPDVVTALTDVPLLQEEQIRVKLHRGASLALTRNQWLRIGQAP